MRKQILIVFSGVLELSSRTLKCLPSCLFEIHLGVNAAPLKSVEASDLDPPESPVRRQPAKKQNTYFDSQDLEVLKARSNEIVELQPELALFGSLKTVDVSIYNKILQLSVLTRIKLHSNNLTAIPVAFSTFTLLTHLDLSANKLTSLPPAIFSLPSLISLDVSHNQLTALPFSQFNVPVSLKETPSLATYFDGEIRRSEAPLPSLRILIAGKNKLTANSIDMLLLPSDITHLDLSINPLGHSSSLINSLAGLQKLEELHLAHSIIDDEAFSGSPSKKFPVLQILDLEETKVTAQAVRTFFSGSEREKSLQFDIATSGPKPGEMYVVVGKRMFVEGCVEHESAKPQWDASSGSECEAGEGEGEMLADVTKLLCDRDPRLELNLAARFRPPASRSPDAPAPAFHQTVTRLASQANISQHPCDSLTIFLGTPTPS